MLSCWHVLIFNIFIVNCFIKSNDKIIISLSSIPKNIDNSIKIINSINAQNISKDLYEIALILSLRDYKNRNELPSKIQSFEKSQIIKIILIKEELNNLSKLLTALKEYENNPILIINNNCILPNGWLDMFINDHKKYPNDAIVASIQYFFGKDGEIKEFSDGFKGEKFGLFNHVPNMIFNFAIVNSDLGGILYPKNYFQNKSFYDQDLFLKSTNNNDDFWQSCFIIMEDKVLRQSSKIYDYTKYLINDSFENKKPIYDKIKLTFIENFPNFKESLIKRQNKIIVSVTSYPKRYSNLPTLIKIFKKQTYNINKIMLFLYQEDYKKYKYNLDGFEVIPVEKNLRPHLKYFYAMKTYRDYAIITLDDDSIYKSETFKLLYDGYIENPNIINGIRAHLITFDNNGEIKKYENWTSNQNIKTEIDFDVFLTGVSGIIYPPDILNIDDSYIPIIEETITCDDMTLKYYEIMKGIPSKWIENKNFLAPLINEFNVGKTALYNMNKKYLNDLCIDKLNLDINKTVLDNLCVHYRNIQTGISIYLFDIYDKKIINNKLYFNINAYSYCPINPKLKFNIFFDKFISYCSLNDSKFYINDKKFHKAIIFCFMNEININLDDYNPIVKSEGNEIIKIYNYKKSSTIIFKNFICNGNDDCILKAILFKKINNDINISLYLNNKNYLCKMVNNDDSKDDYYPIIKEFKCLISNSIYNISELYISGLPLDKNYINKNDNNIIPNQFIITRIVYDKQIIIIGKLNYYLNNTSNEFFINFINPKTTLKCNLKPFSKYVQSRFYCINDSEINKEILIENQIIYSSDNKFDLLLINQETLIKANDSNNIETSNIEYYIIPIKKDIKLFYLLFIVFIIIIIIKLVKRFKKKKFRVKKKEK